MKPSAILATLTAVLCAITARGQSEAIVIDRGLNHRTWARTIQETQPDGSVLERRSSYVELAPGSHRLVDGVWVDTNPSFEVFADTLVARNSAHSVIIAKNLNTAGAIDLLTPDGKRLVSHLIGVAYTDLSTGRSELIAEVKDCQAALLAPNQILFDNALDGPFKADVVYVNAVDGFEQLVLLKEAPPPPEAYGLNPATTLAEIWTEIVSAPEPAQRMGVLRQETDPIKRAASLEPDLTDTFLDWGIMAMPLGAAFALEGNQLDPPIEDTALTAKTWLKLDGRTFLVEKVEYETIAAHLQRLPQGAAVAPRKKPDEQVAVAAVGGIRRPFPKRKQVAALRRATPGQMAQAKLPAQAYVLDYQLLTTLTNATLRGDTTYFASNKVVTFNGSTVIEGGTVVKFSQHPLVNRFKFLGAIDCRTKPGLEATFTASDDDSIGELIVGSSGSPGTNWFAGSIIEVPTAGLTYDLAHLHLRNAWRAVYSPSGTASSKINLSHTQIGYSGYGLYTWAQVTFRNLLMHDVAEAFNVASGGTAVVEQGTFHRGQIHGAATVYLTNCLLITITNTISYASGSNVATNASDAGVFVTVGGGTRYLASGSAYRDVGTTNINPALLADLRQRTTFPPIVLSNAIVSDTVLFPQAMRDTDGLDLGWHYFPIDYALSQVSVSNASLTIQPGTSLGIYGPSSASGLMLLDGANVVCEGNPTNLNQIVRYNLVQEQGVTNWSATSLGRSVATPTALATNSLASSSRFRFTEWSMPANGNDHFYGGTLGQTVTLQDCEFSPGKLTFARPALILLNNLFERTHVTLAGNSSAFTVVARNGTHFEGSLTLQNSAGGTWTIQDNLLDQVTNTQTGTITHNYNGYTTNVTRLTPNGANDVLLAVTNVAYETWPPTTGRRFYLPSGLALINAGSQYATNAGLFHYATTTNQVKEAGTLVDIGFHRVALTNGTVAVDTDLDTLPDYFEDANGNGVVDSGESSWTTAGDWGLRVWITRPRNGANIP